MKRTLKIKAKIKRRRIPRMTGISVNKMIPNFITLAALCFGISAIRFAVDGRWQFAVAAIILAAVLDALDGRMARLLKATSEFGAQLDSLSDAVSFGVAPAVVLYLYVLHADKHVGWAVALLLVVCCCLRLARFNSLLGKLPPYAYNYFQGVPAPMGALLALWPMILQFAYDAPVLHYPHWVLIWVFAVALLTVSTIPTFSFKRMKISYRWGVAIVVLTALLAAGLFSSPWKLISLLCVVYICLIPLSAVRYRRLRLEALRLRGREE